MSRKAFVDKSSWKTPSIYAFASGYGPFRVKEVDPIEQVVVLLYNGDNSRNTPTNEKRLRRMMYKLAGQAQDLLLKEGAISSLDPSICNGILVVDVRDMFKNKEKMDLAL